MDGLVAMHDVHEGFHLYYKDHLGSTRHLNDNTQQRDYFPYGEALSISGSKTNYLFTGKELDNNTGPYYFGARYYDPSIGRWLVPDPLKEDWSPYVYCHNNPSQYFDLDGRKVWGAGASITVGLLGGITSGFMKLRDDKGNQGFAFYGGGG